MEEVRNFGAEIARGEFLCFLDADDLVHPEYFSKCIEVLKRYTNVGFVGSWAKEIGERSGYRALPNFDFPFSLISNQAFSCSLIRRSAYRKGWVPMIMEDYEQWISTVESGWVGVVVPQALFFYRMRRHSRYASGSSYEARIAYQLIVKAHAPTYRRFGDELFLLLFQKPSVQRSRELKPRSSASKVLAEITIGSLEAPYPKEDQVPDKAPISYAGGRRTFFLKLVANCSGDRTAVRIHRTGAFCKSSCTLRPTRDIRVGFDQKRWFHLELSCKIRSKCCPGGIDKVPAKAPMETKHIPVVNVTAKETQCPGLCSSTITYSFQS